MDDSKTKITIGKAVKRVLEQALTEERARFGIFECVDILEREVENVMVCILPEGKIQDVSLRIQHTLIEAFCRENEIKVIKVDCATKLSTIFTSAAPKEFKDRTCTMDFSCVVVMTSSSPSIEDDYLSDYCENFMLGGVVPHGNIEIPI